MRIFKKIMSESNYIIISIINFRDIEPYYLQSLQGLKFIQKLNKTSKKLRFGAFNQIFMANQNKSSKKHEKYLKEIQEIRKNLEFSRINSEKMLFEIENIEKLKREIQEKEEIIRKMSQVRSRAQEDPSLLAGLLSETITESAEPSKLQILNKNPVFFHHKRIKNKGLFLKEAQKYKGLFFALYKEHVKTNWENTCKFADIIAMNEKLKNQKVSLFMEREEWLLRDLKGIFYFVIHLILGFFEETQEDLKEIQEKYEILKRELKTLNEIYVDTLEKMHYYKDLKTNEKII